MAHSRRPFYNTDGTVGRYQANKTDDVMLIQWFFKELSTLDPLQILFAWERPATPPEINGVADENLYTWIRTFQEGLKASGYSITADGIINSVPGALHSQTSITHTKYTLMYLNNLLHSTRTEKYLLLPVDESVPAQLRKAVKDNNI